MFGNNGWYINSPLISWSITDPESPSKATSNCNPSSLTNDTNPWVIYSCSATSSGGNATGSTPKLYRDANAPTVTLNSPSPTIYAAGQSVTANYVCNEFGGSLVATCVAPKPNGAAVNTATPGFFDFTVTGTDNAGWSRTAKVTYAVSTGVCAPVPSDIVSWWTGDNTLTDLIGANHGAMIGTIGPVGMYDPGFVGPSSFRVTGGNGYNFGHDPSLKMTTAFSVSAWVWAKTNPGYRTGTLFSKKGEYGLSLSSGSLLYSFGSQPVKLANFEVKSETWTHVAMTYDAGALTIYANGRPVATETVAATLVDAVPGTDDFVVGAEQGLISPFNNGDIDDVQVYRRALTPAELESAFLSGRSGLCAPAAAALTASATPATYGSDATTTLTAQLTSGGAGVAGRTVAFSIAGTPAGTAVTDNDGNASLGVSLPTKNAGAYAIGASHQGDGSYTGSTATASLTVAKRLTTIVWATPEPITYGASLSPAIFNATTTETVSGSFAYTPNASIPPPNAGPLTLNATFTPGNTANYLPSTASVTLQVLPATPAITLTAGTFTYDKQTHAATVSATGARGETFTPAVTYNGSSTLPLDAGEYTVAATLEATQNYNAASATATLTILKATPTVTVGTLSSYYTYDGTPHSAVASATGVGGEELTPVTITYNGSSTAPTNAGTYDILASYAGTANYATRSASTWLIIGKAGTSVSWVVPQPLLYGQPLGPAQLNATASAPGTFTYTPAAGTVPHRGNVTLQVTFTPTDATNYSGGSGTQTVVVSPAPLTVKANDAVKLFGATLPAFTASFAGFVNGDTPASLAGSLGFSTTATTQSAVGTYPISVGGVSSNDYTITFAAGVLTVQPLATSVAVSSSANPSGVNQPITLTASVSVTPPGAGQPTGTVTFLDGATVLGAAAMQNGTASLTTILATGAHSITATYSGDTSFGASSSAALSQTVNASSTSTTTTVTSSRNPAKTGQSVTLTGRVTSPAGTPAGSVQFLDGDVVIGTGTLNGSGQATLTTTTLAVGSHPITVRYLGSATMPPSLSATLVQVVNTSSGTTKSTTTALSAAPSTGTYGTQTTFSVTVTPPVLNSAPTGNVLFTIDGVSSTIVALSTSNGKGVATLSTSVLPRGKHLVTVTYLGSGTYAGSTATLTYTVN